MNGKEIVTLVSIILLAVVVLVIGLSVILRGGDAGGDAHIKTPKYELKLEGQVSSEDDVVRDSVVTSERRN